MAVLVLAVVLAVVGGALAATLILGDSDSDPDPPDLVVPDRDSGAGPDPGSAPRDPTDPDEEPPPTALPKQSPAEMRDEIAVQVRRHHSAIVAGDYQGAWETLSQRKRLQYRREGDGYATWRDNQATLNPYLDPSGLEVDVVAVNESGGIAMIRVSGMGWSDPDAACAEWGGITWAKYERGAWYYDPGYSTTTARERAWKPRYRKLLGASC